MLKLQYFGHLMGRAYSLEKTLMLGKNWMQGEKGMAAWDGWMASLTQWTWVWASSESWWWTGKPGMLQSMGRKESEMTEWLNWTEHGPAHLSKTEFYPQPVPTTRQFPQASYLSAGRQNKNHNDRKLTELITWITILYNSMKLFLIYLIGG